MKTHIRVSVILLFLVAVLACQPAQAQETPRMGGVLKVALIGEPPSLDLHWTTAVITQQITWHIYETLYTYDQNFTPIPMLAEGHTVADGGRRYTITLRKGIKFHNGKEMTSADVVPSLNRWGKLSTPGKAVWKSVEAVEAKDPYTVVIHLKDPSGSLLFGLGRPNAGAAIHPKEVVEAAGDGQIKEFIGTGPYRFVEHKPDRHIKLARFKDYRPRAEPPTATAASARPIWTRSSSSLSRTWRCAWPASRPASITSPSRSRRTSTTGSKGLPTLRPGS